MRNIKNIPHSICFVIPHYVTFSTGGAEIQVYYLINEFLRKGWTVELICAGKGYEQQIKKSVFWDERVHTHYYKKRTLRFLEFFSVLLLLFKTSSAIYYQRTDFALTGACALYCRLKKKLMVYAAALDTDATRDKYKVLLKDFEYLSPIKKAVRWVDFALIDLMVEQGKNWSHQIVCHNDIQMSSFAQNFGRQTHLIPSCFPIQQDSQKIPKENIVLWVANMVESKQPELFLKLVDNLKDTRDWRFVMLGRKAEGIDKLNNGRVEILGELSYGETLEWFDRARIFVNTSSVEGLPNTFIQSWVKQVLVLSLNVDPNKLLSEKGLGWCFSGDEDRMGEQLYQLIMSSDSYDEVLDKAYEYAVQTYDVSKNMNRLIQLIAS